MALSHHQAKNHLAAGCPRQAVQPPCRQKQPQGRSWGVLREANGSKKHILK